MVFHTTSCGVFSEGVLLTHTKSELKGRIEFSGGQFPGKNPF